MTDAIIQYMLFIAVLGAVLSLVVGFGGAVYQWLKDRREK